MKARRFSKQQVFPAGAGVIPISVLEMVERDSFPRRCGGDPTFNGFGLVFAKFSPQVRG
mgnify:CR=1 FL=1